MCALQGVFRGLQDARTPLQCSLASNFLNVLLAPVLIFWAGWGVKGAAAAIVIAQVGAEQRCPRTVAWAAALAAWNAGETGACELMAVLS